MVILTATAVILGMAMIATPTPASSVPTLADIQRAPRRL